MKVLICIPCLMTGGTEIQTLSIVNSLVNAGHRVTVACYFEYDDTMVNRYRSVDADVWLLSPDGKRPIGSLRTILFLYKGLKRVIKEVRPDVVHVQYMAPGAIPIVLLRMLGCRTIIATAHTSGDIYSPFGLKLIDFLTHHVLSAFQCITRRAEQSFFGSSQMYSPGMRLTRRGNHFTIYNNLPPYIAIADTPRSASEMITIGVVSRLEPIKGMDLVIPAFARIHATNPDTRLLVVGDGSQRALMDQQVKDAGLDEVVEFVGRQTQERLQGYYDRIDILLMPSRSEGFGLTAIEGMARGCVIVAGNTGGLPEVVEDGVVGLLHEPESVDSLTEKTMQLVNDREMLERMQKNTIEHVVRFSFTRYSELINNMYLNL